MVFRDTGKIVRGLGEVERLAVGLSRIYPDLNDDELFKLLPIFLSNKGSAICDQWFFDRYKSE